MEIISCSDYGKKNNSGRMGGSSLTNEKAECNRADWYDPLVNHEDKYLDKFTEYPTA